MKRVKKANPPQKICATCGRPFTWRKKREKVWDDVNRFPFFGGPWLIGISPKKTLL
jgi:hypothetical protein